MKFFATALQKNGIIDNFYNGWFTALVNNHPNFQLVANVETCDVVFICHTHREDFEFDTETAQKIFRLKKPIIVFDFVERGSKVFPSIYLGAKGVEYYANKNYIALFSFFEKLCPQIKLYFKRELLLSEDLSKIPFPVKPAEYTIGFQNYPIETEEQFNRRLIDIFFVWGYSNWSRPILHGELMKYAAGRPSNSLICDWSYIFRDKEPHKIVLIYAPPHRRIPLKELLGYQSQAKISIALNGCGQKCYRHAEVPCNSVMAMQETNLVWSYPWKDGENCIVLPVVGKQRKIDEVEAVKKINGYLKQPEKLYSIYLKGTENFRNYRIDNYIPNYITKEIKNVFG